MTRHGKQECRATAEAPWPKEPLVVHTARRAEDMQMLASPGLSEAPWGQNARPAKSSTGCRDARKPSKAKAEFVKSP